MDRLDRIACGAVLLLVVGCTSDSETAVAPTSSGGTSSACDPGAERCTCYGNGTCNAGLECRSDLCVTAIAASGGSSSVGGGSHAGATVTNSTNAGGAVSAGGIPSTGGGGTASSGTAGGSIVPTGAGGVSTNGGAAAAGATAVSGGAAGASAGGATSTAAGGIGVGGSVAGSAGIAIAGSAGVAGSGVHYVDDPTVCDDTASIQATMSGQSVRAIINTTNNPNKSYVALSNWWGKFQNQTVTLNGLGFTVTNSATTDIPSVPVGYPSVFIGTYQEDASRGSNLPKLVSGIARAPTVLETNVSSLDTSSFSAGYDLWFTATSAPLATSNGVRPSSPGSGGAYLTIWLYKPSNKQPRGSTNTTSTVENAVWDVWIDNTNPPSITYVARDARSGVSFDLKRFIEDAVSRNIVRNSMYLSIVFAGLQIWSGGNGASVTKYCAKVN